MCAARLGERAVLVAQSRLRGQSGTRGHGPLFIAEMVFRTSGEVMMIFPENGPYVESP